MDQSRVSVVYETFVLDDPFCLDRDTSPVSDVRLDSNEPESTTVSRSLPVPFLSYRCHLTHFFFFFELYLIPLLTTVERR